MITGTSLSKTDNTSSITVCGGTDNSKGGSITIYGKDRTNNNGEFSLVANDGTSSSELWGKPNGTLTWGNKKVDTIEEQGDGYIRYSNGLQICGGIVFNYQLESFRGHYGKTVSFPKIFLADNEPIVNISQWRYAGDLTQNVNIYAITSSYLTIETDIRAGVYYTVFGKWK